MTTRLIPIGNSRGIRISKSLIDQYEFDEEVELVAEKMGILILPKRQKARDGWEEALEAKQLPALVKGDTDWLNAPLQENTDWTW